MRLWTIQRAARYDQWSKSRPLVTHASLIDTDLRSAYEWMSEQMAKRVGPPPNGVSFPIWAWRYFAGKKNARPDLRRSLLPSGTAGVLLELELHPDGVVMSDFQKWHCVLNRCHLPLTHAEADRFEARLADVTVPPGALPPEPFASEIVQTWERVFDVDGPRTDAWEPVDQREIQATFWELRAEDIQSVRYFTAR
jgi:hypothetical protein